MSIDTKMFLIVLSLMAGMQFLIGCTFQPEIHLGTENLCPSGLLTEVRQACLSKNDN